MYVGRYLCTYVCTDPGRGICVDVDGTEIWVQRDDVHIGMYVACGHTCIQLFM